MHLSIVGPAYNEEQNICHFIDELLIVVSECLLVDSFDITIVDDHSSDNTYQKVENYQDKRINAIRLSKRSGGYMAMRAGLSLAQGDIVLCLSTDGQDNPHILSEMIDKWKSGDNVIWGLRKKRSDNIIYNIFTSFFYKGLSLITENPSKIDLAKADFCLMDKEVLKGINSCKEIYTSLYGLILWMGFSQNSLHYERRDRLSGKSKWNFRALLEFAKDWVIAFSSKPIKFISYSAILCLVVGGSLIISNLFSNSFFSSINGFTNCVIFIIGGINLFCMGIIGEYLYRTLDETRKRPLFLIEKRTDEDR